MSRIIIPQARAAAAVRRPVLPWWMSGLGSIRFDGVDDKIVGTLPGSMVGTHPFTVVCWLMPGDKAPDTYAAAVGLGTGLGAVSVGRNRSTRKWYAAIYGGAATNGRMAATGIWTRVVLEHDGVAGHPMYVCDNGSTLVAGAAATPNIGTAVSEIGRYAAAGYWYNGAICDVRIYTRVWSQAEVAADFAMQWVDSTGLVRWWKLDAISGGKTHEEIGNTDDTVTGAVVTTDCPFRARSTAGMRFAA